MTAAHSRAPLDLTGQRFGQLTAVELVPSRPGQRAWRCRCACGGSARVRVRELRNGTTRSCGCAKSEARTAQPVRVGERYAMLTVEAYVGTAGEYAMWRCRCDCGCDKVVRGTLLRNGQTKSCGCLRRRRVDPALDAFMPPPLPDESDLDPVIRALLAAKR